MSEIATLGLAVDSRQVVSAKTALDSLTPAARNAQTATQNLTKSHAGMSTQAMAAAHAVRGTVEQLAMGIPVTQVLASHLNQLSYAASGPSGLKGAFVEVASSLKQFLTPTTIAIGSVSALAVGAYLAYSSWKTFALQLDDTAHIAGTTSGAMAQLQAAASFKGISSADFAKGAQGFAEQIYQARNNMGDLVQLLRSNGMSAAGGFETVLGRVADLVQRAAGDTTKQFAVLREAGLPQTMEWVRLLENGSAGIRQATAAATEFGGAANDEMVKRAREFDEGWNKAWTNFGLYARSSIVSVIGWWGQLFDNAQQKVNSLALSRGMSAAHIAGIMANNGQGTKLTAGSDVSGFYKGIGAITAPTAAGATTDPNAVRKRISDEQQLIGILGQSASVGQQVHAVELQIQIARLNGINVTKVQADTLKTLAYEQALGITAIRASTDAQNVEAATIGMMAGQAAAYTAVQNRLNEAKRNHQTLTDADVAALTSESAALGEAAQRADELRFGFDTFSGTMRDLGQQIRQNGLNWQSLGNAGANALGKIADRLMDMGSRQLWQYAFPGGGGGLFSLFGGKSSNPLDVNNGYVPTVGGGGIVPGTGRVGGMVGSLPSYGSWVHPAYFDDAPRMRGGGFITDDGVPIVAHPGERILNAQETRDYNAGRGGGAPIVNITQNNNFNGVNSMTRADIENALAKTKQAAITEAVQAVVKGKVDAPGYIK